MPFKNTEDKRRHQQVISRTNRENYFKGKVCATCGSAESLELDHINPAEKVSHRIWTWSEERRQQELAKCQPLCVACHKLKTAAARDKRKHGTQSMYRTGCRCSNCREGHRLSVKEWRAKGQLHHSPSLWYNKDMLSLYSRPSEIATWLRTNAPSVVTANPNKSTLDTFRAYLRSLPVSGGTQHDIEQAFLTQQGVAAGSGKLSDRWGVYSGVAGSRRAQFRGKIK